MISKQAVLEIIRNHHRRFEISLISQLERNINDLPSISEDGFKRDIIFKLSLALSDYFNDDELSLIKQCLNKLIPVPISDGWIRCDERLPERYARCNFVVVSSNDHYNGGIYGGGYTGDPNNKYSKHEFSCPGIAFQASHWQPLPPAPTK